MEVRSLYGLNSAALKNARLTDRPTGGWTDPYIVASSRLKSRVGGQGQ